MRPVWIRRSRCTGLVAVVMLALTCGGQGPEALAAVLGATGGPVTASAWRADPQQDLDRRIAAVRESLEGASEDVVAAAVALADARGRLAQARDDLDTAQAAVAEADRRDRDLAARLAYARARLAATGRELEDRRQTEAGTRAAIGAVARETYIGGPLTGVSVALQSEDPEEFTDRWSAATAALQVRSRLLARIVVERTELQARQERLVAVRAEVSDLKERAAVVLAQRREAAVRAAAARTEVAALVAQEARALQSARSRAASERARLAALEREQDQLRAMLAARARTVPAGPAGPAAGGGMLARPTEAAVTSGFGMRYHPILGISRLHSGTDFGAACGAPVVAAAAGTVISAGWAGGYGNRVVVDHGVLGGGRLTTTYNHLSRIDVGSGPVSRGTPVGLVGTTGLSTGCHLHFEVLLDGAFVDPQRYL